MILRKCYVIYTMDPHMDTAELKLPHTKFFELGIIGPHFSRMLMHMQKSIKFSKPWLEEKQDLLFHYNLLQ